MIQAQTPAFGARQLHQTFRQLCQAFECCLNLSSPCLRCTVMRLCLQALRLCNRTRQRGTQLMGRIRGKTAFCLKSAAQLLKQAIERAGDGRYLCGQIIRRDDRQITRPAHRQPLLKAAQWRQAQANNCKDRQQRNRQKNQQRQAKAHLDLA